MADTRTEATNELISATEALHAILRELSRDICERARESQVMTDADRMALLIGRVSVMLDVVRDEFPVRVEQAKQQLTVILASSGVLASGGDDGKS